MKNALATWKWSFGVVTHSPFALLTLTLIVAAELYGAYRWLYFPMESAAYLMVIGALWALVVFGVLIGLKASLMDAALDVAASDARSISPRRLLRFNRCYWLRIAGFTIIAFLIAAGVYSLFEWVNSYSLEVASWLTFNTEKPVAQETAEAVLLWIERFLWVVIAGFLVSFQVALVREGWGEALRAAPRLLANSGWRSTFLTSLCTMLVFGGLAYGLVTWHPTATPGFLDYAQIILRNGLALALAVAGWIFWILSLARRSAPAAGSPSLTPDAH